MLNVLKLTVALVAAGLFNVAVSMAVFSSMSAANKVEIFSVVVEETSTSAAMLENSNGSLMSSDFNPIEPTEPLVPEQSEVEILKNLDQILAKALKEGQRLESVDRSNLDEAGLFSSPGPKKNLI